MLLLLRHLVSGGRGTRPRQRRAALLDALAAGALGPPSAKHWLMVLLVPVHGWLPAPAASHVLLIVCPKVCDRQRATRTTQHALTCCCAAFCACGLQRHLPWWHGHLYLVSPGQTPPWLNASHPRVTIVDQNTLCVRVSLPVVTLCPRLSRPELGGPPACPATR